MGGSVSMLQLKSLHKESSFVDDSIPRKVISKRIRIPLQLNSTDRLTKVLQVELNEITYKLILSFYSLPLYLSLYPSLNFSLLYISL